MKFIIYFLFLKYWYIVKQSSKTDDILLNFLKQAKIISGFIIFFLKPIYYLIFIEFTIFIKKLLIRKFNLYKYIVKDNLLMSFKLFLINHKAKKLNNQQLKF